MQTRVLPITSNGGIPDIQSAHHVVQQANGYTAHGDLVVRGPYRYHPTILYIWDTQVGINKVLKGDSAKLDDVGNGPDFDAWANYGNWNHWRCSGVWWDEEKQQNIPFSGRHLRLPTAPGKAPSVGQPWVLDNITVVDPPDKVLPDGSNIFDTETEE